LAPGCEVSRRVCGERVGMDGYVEGHGFDLRVEGWWMSDSV
jgi:hypothetical protein